ncbi:MAG TPA: hypothetical protein VGM62_03340 [Chthoniobacterales bacterium]|jgi:hypothetical protein
MAKEPRREQSINELKSEIARSRERVARDVREFRREIDIPRRIKRSFQQQTVAWVTVAVVVGALLIVLPARRKIFQVEPRIRTRRRGSQKKFVEAGFALGALKFAATLLRPMVVSFITKKVRGFVDQSVPQPAARSRNRF